MMLEASAAPAAATGRLTRGILSPGRCWSLDARRAPLPTGRRGLLVSRLPLSRPDVHADGCEEDHAHDDRLVERVVAEQQIAVVDQRDEEHADDGAPDGALSAEDGRAPDDDPREDGERERRRIGRPPGR